MHKLSIEPIAQCRTRERLSADIARVATGDIDAFIRVYHATSAKLFGIVVRILGRGELAEEILQEVYLRIWQKASDFNADRASPITWLATIARNRALDEGRRRQMSSIEEMPELLEFPSSDDIALDYLAQDELRRLHEALRRLPAEQRRVLELVYFEGLTQSDAARRIGQPIGVVNSCLKHGLKQLKKVLEP